MPDESPERGDNPYEPPRSEIQATKPRKEATPLWARRSVLDWYSSLGTKGRLLYTAGIFVGFNAITWCFGFWFPKMLCVGGACLVIGLLVSGD